MPSSSILPRPDGAPSAWGRLLRLPALFSAPGDPLAGFLLASLGAQTELTHVIPAALGSLCIYAGGMIQNDWADVAIDAEERPDRPLPAGEIPVGHAAVASMSLSGAGIGLAALAGPLASAVAVLLALCVLAYNFCLKRKRVLGPLALAACRGLNVLLGACAAGLVNTPAVAAAGGVALYIYSVSLLARDEASGCAPAGRHLPGAAAMIALVAIGLLSSRPSILALLIGLGLLWQHLLATRALDHVPRAIGGWLRAVILLQAFACACAPPYGPLFSLALVMVWLVAGLLGRRFYAS